MSIALQREQSHAEVYLVVGGWKLWITSPTEMSALGFDWSQVQVVPDGTLAHVPSTPLGPYSIGKASDVMFDNVVFIGLIPHVKPENNCKPPEAIIKRDILVAGWLRVAAERNRDPEGYGTEDYHYDVILDVDFMMQMYGPGGLSTALNGAVLPSHFPNDDDPSPGPPLRFDDVSEFDHTTSRGITMNSFALPNTGERSGHDPDQAKPLFSQAGVLGTDPRGPEPVGYAETNRDYFQTGPVCVFGELNTWHINYEGPWPPWFHVHGYFEGRGTPPAGWVGDPGPSPLPTNWVSDANERYPFNPHNPDDGPRDLQIGDYVIMRGTLWQEHAHDPAPPHSLWRAIPGLQGHAGKLEMHPVDWLKRVDPPAVAKTAYTVACSGEEPPQAGPASRGFSVTFFPYPKQAPWSPATLKCTEIIDGRFTDMTTLYSHSATVTNTNQVVVQVELRTQQDKQGRFKAVYLTWWEAPPYRLAVSIVTPMWVLVGVPTTVHLHAEDAVTHASVLCRVLLDGQDKGGTETDIPYVFERRDVTATVRAPSGSGYLDASVSFPVYTLQQLQALVRDRAFRIWLGRVRGGGRFWGDTWSDWFAAKAELGIPPDVHV